jgi:hypothetical protein
MWVVDLRGGRTVTTLAGSRTGPGRKWAAMCLPTMASTLLVPPRTVRLIRSRVSSFVHILICVLLVAPVVPAYAQEQPPPTDASPQPQAADQPVDDKATAAGEQLVEDKAAGDDKRDKPDRVFGVLPNYSTVEGNRQVPPITAGQAFHMAALNSFDPYVFPFVGVVAALGVGQGTTNYTRRYATALADNSIGNFMTSAVLPSLLHQDPRYFELGAGSFWHRAGYAASRSLVTRSRAGRPQFNVSEIGGNGIAALISNAYYQPVDRNALGVVTRWGSQVMWDTLSNELKEFWPDVRRKLHHQ